MEVIGVGLANIDLVSHVTDDFLLQHKLPKGFSKKLDVLSFARLRADLKGYEAIPGGCTANTICGLAAAGVSTRFYGRIGKDSFESLFRASFDDYTVAYDVAAQGEESSQCAVLITPDGERTFAYIHGSSWELSPDDIDTKRLSTANLIYTESYLFGIGENSNTARHIFETAQSHNIPIVMKIADPDYARPYAQKIKMLAQSGIIPLIVGRSANMLALTGALSEEEALEALKAWPCEVLVTANRNGAYFISQGKVQHFPITPVEKPRNTAGAGDQFAAGFLTGWLDGKLVEECMKHAQMCARMILAHDTARPPLVTKQGISF